MHPSPARRPRLLSPSRSSRLLLAALLLVVAALVAAGCGGGGSDDTSSDVASEDGPLAWLPANSWAIARVSIDPKQIDESIDTLDRLPIWDLASAALPAKDGTGLRAALLGQIAKELPGKQTGGDLEDAFGNEAGVAITSNDVNALGNLSDSGSSNVPIAAWLQVDDESAVDDVLDSVFTNVETHSSKGVDYSTGTVDGDQVAWTTSGDLLLLAPGAKQLERLIATHDGDQSLAQDDDARRALDGAFDGAPISIAVGTDALIDAGATFAEGDSSDSSDGALGDDGSDTRARLARVLRTSSVDAIVPDWIGMSATIDETGLRLRTTWSNPRSLATPDVGSRALVERMPADTEVASGTVNDGSAIERVQDLWADVSKEADVEIADLTEKCPANATKLCAAAVTTLEWILEDDQLAQDAADSDPTATVVVQSLSGTVTRTIASVTAPTPATAKGPAIEVATTGDNLSSLAGAQGAKVPTKVTAALAAAGLTITTSADGLSVTAKVAPASELGRLLTAELTPGDAAALAATGFDARKLLTSSGLTLSAKRVDDLVVATFPPGATSTIAAAVASKADTLADDDGYTDTVDAVDPPKEVGMYAWIDLPGAVDDILTGLSGTSPAIKRIQPTVANNLDPVPGALGWTTRTKVDGEDLGVAEFVLPIVK